MIVFLTDGDPTNGETNVDRIVKNIHDKNTEKVPILSLGFGTDADFKLLKRISAMTDSLSKMIYDGSEAAFQLENFFYRTSRPTLSNVKLRYMGNVDQTSITEHHNNIWNDCILMKKYYAYLQVRQDIARWHRYRSSAAKD